MGRTNRFKNKHPRGFTIIEVVLVLAVAGLIFLVVFAAIPRLQASRRDNQRKRDMEAIYTLILEYQSNTGIQPHRFWVRDALLTTPDTSSSFYSYVEGDTFEDPSGEPYGDLFIEGQPANPGEWRYLSIRSEWHYCNSSNTAIARETGVSNGAGIGEDFAILMSLERGYYCIDAR